MISLEEALQEVTRELALRDRVYPSFVAKGSLKKATAEVQVKRLEAARAYLVQLAKARQLWREAQETASIEGQAQLSEIATILGVSTSTKETT